MSHEFAVTLGLSQAILDGESVEHLDLWLATTTSYFVRLSVGSQARESGLVNPAPRWAGAALHGNGNIAYLALRPHRDESAELGVTAHTRLIIAW